MTQKEGQATPVPEPPFSALLPQYSFTIRAYSPRTLEAEVGIGPAKPAESTPLTTLPPTTCLPRQRSQLYPVNERKVRTTRPLLKNYLRLLIHYS